jgi:hypothetical protein
VLGYNWLTHYNPLIDLVFSSITFPVINKENPISDLRPSMHTTVSEEMEPQPFSDNSDKSNPDSQEDEPIPNPIPNVTLKVDISLVNVVAYV